MPDAATAHVLAAAIAAMGGRERLLSIHTVSTQYVATRQMVEQSERPTGPYFIDHYSATEQTSLDSGAVRTRSEHRGYAGAQWWLTQTEPYTGDVLADAGAAGSFDGKSWSPVGGSPLQTAQERVAFGPERVLFTAGSAADVRSEPDVDRNGTPFHVVDFTWQSAPCQLLINARTNLPWSVAWTRAYPYSYFLNAWGDVHSVLTYNEWSLEPSGVRYPREWTYERVGLPDRALSIVGLSFNGVEAADVSLPAAYVAAHRSDANAIDDVAFTDAKDVQALAPGVELAAGNWNVAFVKQDDGVVVIEAPISPAYAKAAFAFARSRYGLPLKAVITTSDSWPHLAGVRQAVAEGIPVYALDLNRPILERQVAAVHAQRPDDLARKPREADFHWVSTPVDLGSGDNAVRIAPYRTATGERQMMVYFPKRRLLYTSDLFSGDQTANDGSIQTWFTPQYLDEAIGAIEREGFQPQTIWGMHYGPVSYRQIVDALSAFLHGAAPT